jgi:hypothetical protein
MRKAKADVVFLFDVDNTLLDNDRVIADMKAYLKGEVDDKLRILSAVKESWGKRVTTVFVQQGHYATDPKVLRKYPPADLSVKRIGDLLAYGRERFLSSGTAP